MEITIQYCKCMNCDTKVQLAWNGEEERYVAVCPKCDLACPIPDIPQNLKSRTIQ